MGYHVGFVTPCLLVVVFFYWIIASWKKYILFFCWPQTRRSHSEGRHWRHWNAIKMYIRGLLPQLVFPASSGAHAGALGFHLAKQFQLRNDQKNCQNKCFGPRHLFSLFFLALEAATLKEWLQCGCSEDDLWHRRDLLMQVQLTPKGPAFLEEFCFASEACIELKARSLLNPRLSTRNFCSAACGVMHALPASGAAVFGSSHSPGASGASWVLQVHQKKRPSNGSAPCFCFRFVQGCDPFRKLGQQPNQPSTRSWNQPQSNNRKVFCHSRCEKE